MDMFWDTNVCESMDAKSESSKEYLLSNRRGLDITELIEKLREVDENDFINLHFKTPFDDIKYCANPEWKGKKHRKCKWDHDDLIFASEKLVAASKLGKTKKVKKDTSKKRKAVENEKIANRE